MTIGRASFETDVIGRQELEDVMRRMTHEKDGVKYAEFPYPGVDIVSPMSIKNLRKLSDVSISSIGSSSYHISLVFQTYD